MTHVRKLNSDLLAALQMRLKWPGRQPRSIAANVWVQGDVYRTSVTEKPPVGATIDIGFPARVTQSKAVAGGGVLIVAERASAEDESSFRSEREIRQGGDGRGR
jgi:hypothetical protein